MTTVYFQSVIDELNKKCENRHLPMDSSTRNKDEDFAQRLVWNENDIYFDEEGKLHYNLSCRVDFYVYDYYSNNVQESVCNTCRDIIHKRITKVFERDNLDLNIEINNLKEEVQTLKELVAKLLSSGVDKKDL